MPEPIGRRERSKRDKRERIEAAAAALFDERGYAGVTTQEVAERADVAAGTLFRYASSKAELLLMVYNARVADSLVRGRAAAARRRSPLAKVMALLEPLVVDGRAHDENTAAYQREVMFGSPEDPFRAEALRLFDGLVAEVAEVLASASPGQGARDAAPTAAEAVLAVFHVAILRAARDAPATPALLSALEAQVGLLVRGFLDAAPTTAREGASS